MYVSLQKRTCNYFCIFQFSTGVYLLQRDICVFEAVDQPLLCVTKAVPVPYQVQDVCFTTVSATTRLHGNKMDTKPPDIKS